jgi:glycosyltransferase involved in cell wall biosynthesis
VPYTGPLSTAITGYLTGCFVNILYISQYFPPEMGAPAARVSELARHWVKASHQVTVLTGFPNHPMGVVPLQYRTRMRHFVCRERIDGIEVVRTWLLPLPNRKAYERILNYSSFCLSSSLTGMFLKRPDLIIATSPQLLVGQTGWWLSRLKKVPFVFEIRDLWPESLSAVGVAGENSFLNRGLGALANFLYRACQHIIVVTPAFRDELTRNRKLPVEKISVVENGVETDLFSPNSEGILLRPALRLQGKFVVSYIGTLGLAHDLTTALEAAARLRELLPDVVLQFVGEGADKARLISIAKERRLSNVRFLPEQPRESIPGLIATSDVCLVTLKKAEVFKTVIPTKMLEFMACGKPIVASVDGQARRIFEMAHAGIFVEPENPTGLADVIEKLYRDPQQRQVLGENGRRHIAKYYSRQQSAQRYAEILERVSADWKSRSVTHARSLPSDMCPPSSRDYKQPDNNHF